ncbi:MAG: FGGY family carbohydrate kinase [Candidatus Latescibacterota bacterium]
MQTLLGIDLGTTGCKAALYSLAGERLGQSYLEIPLLKPGPGVVEQDAAQWWTLTQEAIRQALRSSGVSGQTVQALSVSSQGISFVPVDEQGCPLAHAISWLDTRATSETEQILSRLSEAEIFRLTGKRASPAYGLPKLLWLRAHQPELFARTHQFLTAHDFLLFQFTGQFVTDHTIASGMLVHDIARMGWSAELLGAFDIPVEKLPDIRRSGTALGKIRPEVARILGINEGALVAVGGQDQKCAALGASIRTGTATVSLGTASAISALVDHPLSDPERRIPLFPFFFPSTWDLEGVVGTAGGALRWLRETMFPKISYPALDEWAALAPPGANGVRFYPHLSGAGSPYWRADVLGAFLGLTLSTGPGDLVRSVLEGVAFQIRANLEVLESLGIPVAQLVLFGGGAQSGLWPKIIGGVTGRPVAIARMGDVATWGAALLAGIGAGLLTGEDLERGMIREEPVLPSPPECVEQYEGICGRYRIQEEKLMRES